MEPQAFPPIGHLISLLTNDLVAIALDNTGGPTAGWGGSSPLEVAGMKPLQSGAASVRT